MNVTNHDLPLSVVQVSAWSDSDHPGVALTHEDGEQVWIQHGDIPALIAALQDCQTVLDLMRAIP